VRAQQHAELAPEVLDRWADFPKIGDEVLFPEHLGLRCEEIREDYARLRLPYRPEHRQPAGVVHGGAIASLIDTCVVPAILWPYDGPVKILTVTLSIRFRSALVEEDAVAEGWIDTRGRTTVFCSAEVVGATSGAVVADATLVYKVPPR
jgi:uncharacterized protein (TIGR00369 family)